MYDKYMNHQDDDIMTQKAFSALLTIYGEWIPLTKCQFYGALVFSLLLAWALFNKQVVWRRFQTQLRSCNALNQHKQ